MKKVLSAAALIVLAATVQLRAEGDVIVLPEINVLGEKSARSEVTDLESRKSFQSDTSKLLEGIPGISFQTGGGVSALPYINGLGDERIKVIVDGVTTTAACPNHMNPALSYIPPSAADTINVYAGISPVSQGGDSIGGTIAVQSADPVFAEEGFTTGGILSSFYRSNGDAFSAAADIYGAAENFGISYKGSFVRSGNYESGNGNDVLSSEYEAENHRVTFAGKIENHLLSLDLGSQYIPYQGYVNQFMDMTENKSRLVNLRYKGRYGWGNIDTRLYRQTVRHSMDMLDDKADAGRGPMPMETDAEDIGYSLKAAFELGRNDVFRIGHEFHRFTLDDWWPPVAGSMMMGPNTFWNINDGKRQRIAVYAELDKDLTEELSAQLGVRYEYVTTNTGDVRGYADMDGMMSDDVATSNAFNALDRKRTDNNVDVTAALRWDQSIYSTYELGFARKVRTPSLYERYIWSKGSMAGSMNNWFGDLNGYIGNPDLEPETAYTLRFTADWHDFMLVDWQFKISVYYTYVKDYINAEVQADTDNLKFVNHDARLYGTDISAEKVLGKLGGEWKAEGAVSYVRGEDTDSDTDLYNIQPLTGKVKLGHKLGGWESSAEVQAVAKKSKTDDIRNELKTSGTPL